MGDRVTDGHDLLSEISRLAESKVNEGYYSEADKLEQLAQSVRESLCTDFVLLGIKRTREGTDFSKKADEIKVAIDGVRGGAVKILSGGDSFLTNEQKRILTKEIEGTFSWLEEGAEAGDHGKAVKLGQIFDEVGHRHGHDEYKIEVSMTEERRKWLQALRKVQRKSSRG